ncbi:hypothetical protein HHSLTHF2_01430 [Vreelandella venusta]|uniref:Uncharacterized protein n=1 Tax=Halomonas hydrothermalis TaxID=115561 RepID=A0A6F8TZY3_9GAMM|nr:hypothetical protein HHSLTHF2_01430 [Halomonas hydrothermalis]
MVKKNKQTIMRGEGSRAICITAEGDAKEGELFRERFKSIQGTLARCFMINDGGWVIRWV